MIVLSSILLLVIIASNVYLRGKIGQGADMLVTDERLISQLDTAIDANKAFGDLKYWLLELSVEPRERTEDNVIASRSVLEDRVSPRGTITAFANSGVPGRSLYSCTPLA